MGLLNLEKETFGVLINLLLMGLPLNYLAPCLGLVRSYDLRHNLS